MTNRPIAWWTQELARRINDSAEADGHPTVRRVLGSIKLDRFYVEVRDDEGVRLLTVEVKEG